MKITTENYLTSLTQIPSEGQHIIAHQAEGQIVVYQAYKPAIADFAVKNQRLGGEGFSYERMSWIKPNFLWMMFRCGWANKENQERILAFWIDKADFEDILGQAAFSTFIAGDHESHDAWKQELATKAVRLQWDPDHNPYGAKITRRAIQLGLKGATLEKFGRAQVRLIEDVTEFVLQQKQHIDNKALESLLVPQERVYLPTNPALRQKIRLS